MTVSREVLVTHKVGLHARPAALFVKTAASFKCQISIQNISKQSEPVNAKSILKLLTIGVSQNHLVKITADGADESAAIEALCGLIERNFDGVE